MKHMHRLPAPWGDRIDRDRPVAFRFDGREATGFAGDSVASAILADPRQPDFLARSFKYHRPRSILLGNGMDANQYVSVDGTPNLPADGIPACAGVDVGSQNTFGSLTRDYGAGLQMLSRFLPAGFYYDTFFRPAGSWPFWEKIIRRFAGLGTLDPALPPPPPSDKLHLFCAVAVIGGGIAGLGAALAAAKAGRDVILIERDTTLGGKAAHARLNTGERQQLADLVEQVRTHPAITVLTGTTCAGWFGGNLLTAHAPRTYYHIKAGRVVAAMGAAEQPLVFRNNDLPGILLASAASRLMRFYGICPGRSAVVQTANRFGYEAALTLADAGCRVQAVIDMRRDHEDTALAAECAGRGIEVIDGMSVTEARAKGGHLAGIVAQNLAADGTATGATRTWECDTFVTSIGFTPLMQLACHSGGEVVYDATRATLRIASPPENAAVCGSLNGLFGFAAALGDGEAAGAGTAQVAAEEEPVNFPWIVFPHPKGKEFVDLDEDQTIGDIQAAVAAGFAHMELMKRYTTTGMGPSQGRTTALNALRVFAAASGMDLGALRITTQRPPFEPESFANLAAGSEVPQRRTVLHGRHLRHGAVMMPAGSWLRPAYYGAPDDKPACVEREIMAVRQAVGLFDASTHGGFQLSGPDCDRLLSAAYVNDFGDFATGQTRSALRVDELGSIVDDCVACRVAPQTVYMVTSSGASAPTNRRLRKLVIELGLDVTITELSGTMSVINLCGPLARDVMARMIVEGDISAAALPLHGFCHAVVNNIPVTIIRGDFVGELTFEFHVGSAHAMRLWEALLAAGEPSGILPFGVLAQRVLRLEKGHFIIGQDTDHATTPDDIGRSQLVAMEKPYFVGRSALATLRAKGTHKALVPFDLPGAAADVPDENRLLQRNGTVIGRITSAEYSPLLGRIVGLAALDVTDVDPGDLLAVWDQSGSGPQITIRANCAYDPARERQAV